MSELELRLHGERVGLVTPVARDRTRVNLTVDRDYRQSIVLSESFAALPGRAPSDAVSNFLGGYVPEGNHRARMAAKRRIDKEDLFALLTEFGGSIAGALTLVPPGGAAGASDGSALSDYSPLSDAELAARLRQALVDSDQGIPTDSRSTLPGYQPKVLVTRLGDAWASPHGAGHSTHILKPQVPARPHRLYDEHYSHLLARQLGLSAYDSTVAAVEGVTFLAIERFDRTVRGNEVVLHHQEDLAQALGLDWRNTDVKFQEPAWPDDPSRATLARIAGALSALPSAASVLEQWVRHIVYRLVIGDNDAHAKNVALLHSAGASVAGASASSASVTGAAVTGAAVTGLAPVYDAVPNLFQDGLISWQLALAIDGEFDHRRVSVESLLAEVAGWKVMRVARAADVVAETLRRVESALDAVPVPRGASPGMAEQIRWNVSRLLAGDEIGERPR
ncbi:type II toxin-antitoxin system HipA family toxin [Demequina salsinemoris]|uniref:type II toxin-antitoxin system HipA family toxin n=1 Tax=Demequina salsinemoris TaxID=577470 RepID=UPI0007814A76|nr:HipA domain-containing protein [Demequina salsinemoris]